VDPFVVLILTIIALTGGGAGSAAVVIRRQRRRDAFRKALLAKTSHQGRGVSIFDVFWDLGVSDYALALMDHHGILPHDPQDFDKVHSRLEDLIEAHGTYTDFIEDNLAAIQEFYRDHRDTGHRRKIPTLTLRDRKLLPAGSGDEDNKSADQSTALVGTRQRAVDGLADGEQADGEQTGEGGEDLDAQAREEIERDLGLIVQDSAAERQVFREEGSPLMLTVRPDEQMPAHRGVDVDELVRLEPMAMLKNIFDGRLTDEVQKWWKFRHLRAAKSRLDEHFAKFYSYYADLAGSNANFYGGIYDTATRWEKEARRLEELEKAKPWKGEAFSDCAEVLVAQSRRLAWQLASRAKRNVDTTVERIHRCAREGDKAMAGYLLYLNHHAFFAGRGQEYGEHVQRIERQAYRVREELRKLKKEGQL
jgi:hypothetical protein